MDFAWIYALALLAAAHLVRRAAPALVGLKERSLPFSWPWLELAGGFLGWQIGRAAGAPPPGAAWPLAVLTLLLLAACATDYLVKLIPDRLVFGGLAAGLVLSASFPGLILGQPLHDVLLAAWGLGAAPAWLAGLALAAAGALVGFALLELVRRLAGFAAGLEVMGMGDSKLLMMIGAFTGPGGAAATLALSFLVGVVHGGLAAAVTRQPHAPFGPALAAAAWLYLFGGGLVMALWERFQLFVLSLPFAWLAGGYAVLLACVILLILRVRRRAAEYEEIIEADYREIDRRLAAPDGAATTDTAGSDRSSRAEESEKTAT